MRLPLFALLLTIAALCAADPETPAVSKIIDSGADVAWVQGAWVSAGGRVQLVEDAPPGSEFKRSMEMEVNFPGKGFMFYNAEPAQPLIVPGRLKSLTVWHRGPGGTIGLRDGWNRGEANGRKFEWGLPNTDDAWKQSTFKIPADWVQPITIAGLQSHNWGEDTKVQTRRIRLSRLEASYDLSDTDLATGALKSWKPDPDGASRKDAPKECPRAPMLALALDTGRECNIFAGEPASVTISANSWKAGKLDGTLTWSLTDLSSGEPAKTPLKSGTVQVQISDRPLAQVLPLPTPRLGLYRFDAQIAWKDGGKDVRSLTLATIAAVPKDTPADRDASPYGLNIHSGGRVVAEAFSKAGIRWMRDYAWGFGQMLGARDGNGAFTGWPWYPKILDRFKKYDLRVMPCLMNGIPAADGSVPTVPRQWRKDMNAILAAFPDVTYWELANEWDLDWENKHGAKLDRAKDWPAYRAYHKAFGQMVAAAGGIAVENGRAGAFPDEIRSMVKDGSFNDIQITNGHFYTGVDTPELSANNANTGAGGTGLSYKICFQDLLRESYRSSQADGKQRQFWLTEFAYDTKAGFIVTKYQQAIYLQRAWMMTFANNVEKAFWFGDIEAPKATAFFDGCGFLDETAQPKLAYCTMSALTRILPNPKYLGPIEAGPGTWGYLFEDHGKLVASLWTVEKEEGPQVEFASGKLIDFLGNPITGNKVKLGLAPVFCVDVAPTDRLVKQACYEVSGLRFLDLAAGDKVSIPVAVTNHRKEALKGGLKLRLPEGWTALADNQTVEALAGAKAKAELACTISPTAKAGEYEVGVQVDENGALCELRVRVQVGAALAISAPALGNKPGESAIEVTVSNRSQRALDGLVTPQLPAGWKAEPATLKITQMAPGATQALPLKITWDAGWKPGEEAWAKIATTDGVTSKAALQPGVITIPRLAKFTADGDFAEWPASSLLPGWVIGCEKAAGGADTANAEVRLAWSEQGLAVALMVKDSLVQSGDPRSFWEMDTLEVFLDSTGTFAQRDFVATDHQFWLVPQIADKRAYLGRWKRNNEIPEIMYDIKGMNSFAKAIPGGYVYEALIPAAQITGFAPKAGATFGVDLMLTINGPTGKREVYWPWSKKDNPAGKPQIWGMVKLGN